MNALYSLCTLLVFAIIAITAYSDDAFPLKPKKGTQSVSLIRCFTTKDSRLCASPTGSEVCYEGRYCDTQGRIRWIRTQTTNPSPGLTKEICRWEWTRNPTDYLFAGRCGTKPLLTGAADLPIIRPLHLPEKTFEDVTKCFVFPAPSPPYRYYHGGKRKLLEYTHKYHRRHTRPPVTTKPPKKTIVNRFIKGFKFCGCNESQGYAMIGIDRVSSSQCKRNELSCIKRFKCKRPPTTFKSGFVRCVTLNVINTAGKLVCPFDFFLVGFVFDNTGNTKICKGIDCIRAFRCCKWPRTQYKDSTPETVTPFTSLEKPGLSVLKKTDTFLTGFFRPGTCTQLGCFKIAYSRFIQIAPAPQSRDWEEPNNSVPHVGDSNGYLGDQGEEAGNADNYGRR